jgi:hypothetical protein
VRHYITLNKRRCDTVCIGIGGALINRTCRPRGGADSRTSNAEYVGSGGEGGHFAPCRSEEVKLRVGGCTRAASSVMGRNAPGVSFLGGCGRRRIRISLRLSREREALQQLRCCLAEDVRPRKFTTEGQLHSCSEVR